MFLIELNAEVADAVGYDNYSSQIIRILSPPSFNSIIIIRLWKKIPFIGLSIGRTELNKNVNSIGPVWCTLSLSSKRGNDKFKQLTFGHTNLLTHFLAKTVHKLNDIQLETSTVFGIPI